MSSTSLTSSLLNYSSNVDKYINVGVYKPINVYPYLFEVLDKYTSNFFNCTDSTSNNLYFYS